LNVPQFQFEWDEIKAAANLQKHNVSFDLAATVFRDPRLLTVADLEHSESEDRWFSIGFAYNGTLITVVYLWLQIGPTLTKIRLISAREATQAEIRQYVEGI
jgi:hypothetical protein